MGTTLRACLVAVFLLLPLPHVARAQSGAASVTLTGQVSGAVALSIHEAHAMSDRVQISTADVDSATTAVSISGSGRKEERVRLRLRLRSNVGYSLRASVHSPDALAVRLSIAEVRATGKFVHPEAVGNVMLGEEVAGAQGVRTPSLPVQNRRLPVAILSGSPISKAGTFSSPDNAMEFVLNLEIQSESEGESWSTRLTISAAPAR